MNDFYIEICTKDTVIHNKLYQTLINNQIKIEAHDYDSEYVLYQIIAYDLSSALIDKLYNTFQYYDLDIMY